MKTPNNLSTKANAHHKMNLSTNQTLIFWMDTQSKSAIISKYHTNTHTHIQSCIGACGFHNFIVNFKKKNVIILFQKQNQTKKAHYMYLEYLE